jgi:DNA polymerase bacteriophage-type
MGKARTPATTAVEIVVSPAHRAGVVNLEARQNGLTVDAVTLHPDNAEKLHRFARAAGVKDEDVRAAIATAAAPEAADTASPQRASFAVTLRGLHELKAHGRIVAGATAMDALQAALAATDYPAPEPVLEWQGTDDLALIDIDFHDLPLEERPLSMRLEAIAAVVHPRPALSWVTHGQGLRLGYASLGGFTAAELAACAALAVRGLEPTATVEILARTRHPGYPRPDYPAAGPVRASTPTSELGPLARFLGSEADNALVDEWLAESGYQRGHRYEHDRCPVDPRSPSHAEPVFVGDDGIVCFKCEAGGLCLGSRRAGFFPWSALVAGGLPSRLRTAAQCCCHWEHAQHIVAADTGLEGDQARLCYSALLKAVHGPDDPRVQEALWRGEGLVRMDGYWATADLARGHRSGGLRERLETLPAVKYLPPEKGGKPVLTTSRERLGMFLGVDDLSAHGYPRLVAVRGMRVFGQWQRYPDPHTVPVVMLPAFLQPEAMRLYRPRYVPRSKRMPLSKAEAILEGSFPGLHHNYLKLLIAARGCAEGGVGPPPRIAVDGPSGAGKDTTVKIAAALLGDTHRDVPWVPSVVELHRGLFEAAQTAGLVTSSEVLKMVRGRGGDLLARLNAFLTFDRGLIVRPLYIGPVSVRQTPALILTNISFPPEVRFDVQVGRRFAYVHLERVVYWQHQVDNNGIERWRVARQEHADAGNAVVSHVIDEFFAGTGGAIVFEDIARALGFGLLNEGVELGLDPREDLLRLYEACCSPQAVVAPEGRWRGRGWRLVSKGAQDPLSVAWWAVCDNPGDGFTSSRRVKEADWAGVLGAAAPVECDLLLNGGSTLGIRFRSGGARSHALRVNGEIERGECPPGPPGPGPSTGPGPGTDPPPPPTPPPTPGGATAEPLPDLVPASPPKPPVNTRGDEPVFLAIETRSACNPIREGGRRFAAHRTTEILTITALIDDRVIAWIPVLDRPPPAGHLWPDGFDPALPVDTFTGSALPAPLGAAIAAGRPLCAHDAFGVGAHLWAARGLPGPSAWLDTLPDARAAGLPGGLEKLRQRLFPGDKDTACEDLIGILGRPDHRGLFRPLTTADAARLTRHTIAEVLRLAQLHDVVGGRAEPEVLALDRAVNERGVAFDAELARALFELVAQETRALGLSAEEATNGSLRADDLHSTRKVSRWLRSVGVRLPDLRRATVEEALRVGDRLDPAVRRVLEARLGVSRITAGKLERALAACDSDGRLRDQLVYHKAHTGRWSSRGVQLHNLPGPHDALKDLSPLLSAAHDPERFRQALPPGVSFADGLSALVRPCFRAAPGKLLLIADYASVEARGVAWCAGEAHQLDLFAQGADNYCDLASQIFGRPVTPEMERERAVGKEAVLGCGYGMGPERFAQRCAARGVDLAAAGTSAEAVVEGYRDAFPAIAGTQVVAGGRTRRQGGLWQEVGAAALAAVRKGREVHAGRCLFQREGSALVVQLPSGRPMYYQNTRVEDVVPSHRRTVNGPPVKKRTLVYDDPQETGRNTYGAKLVENIVQAICRDLLVASLLECERQDLPVVLHVHDEVVVDVEASEAGTALKKLLEIMSTPPAWAEGLPLEVRGFASERYTKHPPRGATVLKARNGKIV